MEPIELGISNSVSAGQVKQTDSPIVSIESGMRRITRLMHLWKALIPILVTLSGRVIATRAEQPEKDKSPTVVSVGGTLTEANLTQPENMRLLIVVTCEKGRL